MTTDPFDALMSSHDPAMAVVTTAGDGQIGGCLVGFHGQASIEPHRYAVWLSKANHTYALALRATHLAVHLLADDTGGRALASHFGGLTGDEVDKFAGIEHAPGPGGVPLLAALPNRMVLRRVVLLDDGGDHVCATGEPVDAATTGPFRALRLAAVRDLTPGHPAD